MYSSIEEEDRPEVIDKCYWPLFRLFEMGFSIGIEASGITLEIILSISPEWIKKLRDYINEGKIEFLGSGYSQIIGPLVPAKVNDWNQNIGLDVYEELLNIRPQIALVNEMAYSGGIIEHYLNYGYKAIVMEWNNPRKSHPEWENEWRYYTQKAIGVDGRTIPVIWADSIAFQKFQRYAHAEYDLTEYLEYLEGNSTKNDRFFPLYCNDAEIFDYRPNRYHTEVKKGVQSEYERILNLYYYLESKDWAEFVFPSQVLDGFYSSEGGNKISLESPEQPIPVKKQEKYNINRWALTGRNDLGINTKCYQIYHGLVNEKSNNPEDWKELCYLWSSDFRTHVTKKRWEEYVTRLNELGNKWSDNTITEAEEISDSNDQFTITEDQNQFTAENNWLKIVLNKNKGLTIKELVFKELTDKPLLVTLDHGYYDDISLGADYYSGHAIIERSGEHKVTDLGKVEPEVVQYESGVDIRTQQNWSDFAFNNRIVLDSDTVTIEKKIESKSDEKSIIHPFNITFNPEAWDRESLYIETNNGGKTTEKFYLQGQSIAHGDIYSSLISARHGFGNTEGVFVVGDKDMALSFECNMTKAALIPSIVFLPQEGSKFFFRVQYSAREMDETNKINGSTLINTKLTIIGIINE